MENTNGVVVGLCYDDKRKIFWAKAKYEQEKEDDNEDEDDDNGMKVVVETFPVSDEWVFDNYGQDVAAKLIDRSLHRSFMEFPWTTEKEMGTFMLETKKIVRVRFIPAPNKQSNKLGNEEGVWQGLQDNGEVATVREDALVEQFGE
jgi:hypothetical protein